ncbi:MAG: ribbon-helix-helix protein, CopG family [Gammaproteobacteria bacterium]|nr:ribbon-helix-helix protein, CopG family [Gammaproteobacteria bacterium]
MSSKKKTVKADPASTFRTSISFPAELYRTLEALAKQKKVSVAWIVRDAAETYIREWRPAPERKG